MTLLCLCLPLQLFSDEKKYGSLIYHSEIPNSVFVIGELKQGDSFNLRKLLRNHDITTVVLASPGGSVWEGLNMAGIVFDKGLILERGSFRELTKHKSSNII